MDPSQKLDRIKRKLIEEVVIDKLTPIKRDFNVDFKQLRKYIEDCMTKLGEHSNRHTNTQQQIDQMNVTILRQLKNTDNEKKLLDREINRLNEIDRMKVAHARNSFFNPDTKSLLPTLDTMYASQNVQGSSFTPSVGQPSIDIATSNELKGQCERFAAKPSQRQRVVIAKTSDGRHRQTERNLVTQG